MPHHELSEDERRRDEERDRERYDRDRELHWKRYDSPSRRSLAERYRGSPGYGDEGGTPGVPHPYDPNEE